MCVCERERINRHVLKIHSFFGEATRNAKGLCSLKYTRSIKREPSRKDKGKYHLPNNCSRSQPINKINQRDRLPFFMMPIIIQKEEKKKEKDFGNWSENSTSSNTLQFLSHQIDQKKTQWAANHAFFRFFPT